MRRVRRRSFRSGRPGGEIGRRTGLKEMAGRRCKEGCVVSWVDSGAGGRKTISSSGKRRSGGAAWAGRGFEWRSTCSWSRVK